MNWTWPKWRAVLLDLLERAGWSAGQVFFATLLAGGSTVAGLPWSYAATLGLGAAVVSVAGTVLQYLGRKTDLAFWPDLGLRLAKTFLGSLFGSFVAAEAFDIMTFDWATALDVAFLATLTALGKGLLARGPVSSAPDVRTSPSTLPVDRYEEAVARPR
ncbi:hypothetical protein OG738_26460 [Amycolatopsis sp. NBC_01488]|uniref:hypothetical protein n=1 Tax=Amycolatopsis sp. NBC_01488 TaxID=2903563 RepID=UPI002E2ACBA5|nr:hypothetical protein [Amycolatopsis sp. NBC_01488]